MTDVPFGSMNAAQKAEFQAAILAAGGDSVARAAVAAFPTADAASAATIAARDRAEVAAATATTAFTPGKNKFNAYGASQANSQYASAGNLQGPNAGFNTTAFTDYQEITPGTYVSNSDSGATTVAYDINKAVLGTAASISKALPRVFPAGTAFYRTSFSTVAIEPTTFQIEAGTVATYFEPFAKSPSAGPTRTQVASALGWAANDLTFPRKQYLLKGIENNFYHRALQRRNVPGLFYTRISGSAGGASMISRDRYSRITPTAAGSGALTAVLYDGNFDPVATKVTTAVVTDPATPTAAVNVLAMGDSWLDIGVILRTLMTTVSGLSLVGTRKITKIQGATYSGPDLRYDGRSGADLAYIMTAIKSPASGSNATGFSAFIHPPGYNFIGNTNSWKDALAASPGLFTNALTTTAQTMRGGFSASTGYPAAPQVNDLLWDDGLVLFKSWDGSAWQTVTVDVATFVFDFAKYLSVYSVPAPKIIYIALGPNDFNGKEPRDVAGSTGTVPNNRDLFAKWHTAANTGYMDKVLAGIQSYDATIKVGLMVPEILSEEGNTLPGTFVARQNAAMWEARRRIIETWDNATQEAANVFVVDTGSAVDPKYGFTVAQVTPFAQYSDGETERQTIDPQHPSGGATGGGFAQYGVRLAAWVQAMRA